MNDIKQPTIRQEAEEGLRRQIADRRTSRKDPERREIPPASTLGLIVWTELNGEYWEAKRDGRYVGECLRNGQGTFSAWLARGEFSVGRWLTFNAATVLAAQEAVERALELEGK